MKITRQKVAQKLIDYIYHRIKLSRLVEWAELAMMDANFDEQDLEIIHEVVSRVGLSDVRAFVMNWEDCEDFLSRLGYQVKIEVTQKQVTA